jgi:hypothetical protein
MAQIMPSERSRHRPQPAGSRQGTQQGSGRPGPDAELFGALQRKADASSGVAGLRALGETAQRAGMEEEEPLQGKFREPVQRASLEEEEPLQGKFDGTAQLMEEEELLQGRFQTPVQREEAPAPAGAGGLPGGLRAGIETLSGVGMDGVRVHYNSSRPAQLNAHAYAQGTDIHLAPGQEQHLPHEAWHVVQQAQGRVEPTTDVSGTPVNDSAALEHEADVMGERANRK